MKKGYESWRKIYYPIEASEAAKGSMLDAVKHSLKKWTGLTKANLKKYGLRNAYGLIGTKYQPYEFWADDDTCSLCNKYLHKDGNCRKCPLYIVRDGVQCDSQMDAEKESPYGLFIAKGKPTQMIKWLRKAKKYAEEEGEKK